VSVRGRYDRIKILSRDGLWLFNLRVLLRESNLNCFWVIAELSIDQF